MIKSSQRLVVEVWDTGGSAEFLVEVVQRLELLGCGGIRPHCKYDFFCISANFMSFLPGGHLESFVLQYFSELIQTPEAHTANGVFREAETPTQFGIRSLFLGKEKKLQQQSAAVGQFLHGLA